MRTHYTLQVRNRHGITLDVPVYNARDLALASETYIRQGYIVQGYTARNTWEGEDKPWVFHTGTRHFRR